MFTNLKKFSHLTIVLFLCTSVQASEIKRVAIGITSSPATSEVNLILIKRFQQYQSTPVDSNDIYDRQVNSPKSAIFLSNNTKFYINSLEGFRTAVYDAANLKPLNPIQHRFELSDSSLFNNETTIFDYHYAFRTNNYNVFSGKPVEACLSHNDKYLWVTYYRRSYDTNAVSPSALAIIDTEKDQIVRVMPSGPLPKMIAASADNHYIAVTHWGDNTIGIIDISSDHADDFKYIQQFIVDRKLSFDFDQDEIVDRDNDCGNCLRGTVFTPDSKYLLVGRMGGSGGIAVFDMNQMKYLGSVFGMKSNLRHLIIVNDELYLSSNLTGYVQKANLNDFIQNKIENRNKDTVFNHWQSCYTGGPGVRTITASSDGKYIFATVNTLSKIVVIRSGDMKVISSIDCDSYPVGMAISADNKMLLVTSQGKEGQGGHSVMVFKIDLAR